MGRVEVGMYFRLFDFDDQKPQEVVNAKIVVNEMQDTFARKMRQIKQRELALHATSLTLAKGGALAVLREGRTCKPHPSWVSARKPSGNAWSNMWTGNGWNGWGRGNGRYCLSVRMGRGSENYNRTPRHADNHLRLYGQ